MLVDDVKRGSNRVTFYLRPKQDAEATAEAGRPIFKMQEYIKIEVPADRNLEVDRPVREEDKEKHAKQYEAFKSNQDQDTASGTLLSASGLVPPERVEELAFFRIRTVEQLAGVSDGNIQSLGLYARSERQRARDFLEAAKSNAPLLRLQAALDKSENERTTMANQLAELQAAVDSLRRGKGPDEEGEEALPRRKRGRPAKAVEAEG